MDFTFQKQNARKYFQGRRLALVGAGPSDALSSGGKRDAE